MSHWNYDVKSTWISAYLEIGSTDAIEKMGRDGGCLIRVDYGVVARLTSSRRVRRNHC